jgi:hypothetical protein
MSAKLAFDRQSLAGICQRYRIKQLSLFGSVVRDDFDPDHSDIDVLVEFTPGADRSLFTIVNLQDALTDLFGRPAHVVTPGSLSKYFREQVIAESEPQYLAA